jgi:adenine deaminase
VVDATGRYVVPGFIDAHMHLESSKLLPDEFARLVLPLGTTAVVADPHEIANVLGTDGVHWLLDASADIPLDVYFMASSSVPASEFESPRRALTEGDLEALLRRRRVLGVAEMMNFPGVVSGDAGELAKLALATHVDGHAPGVEPCPAGLRCRGIRSDTDVDARRGRERLRAGNGCSCAGVRRTQPAHAPAARCRIRAWSDRVLERSRAGHIAGDGTSTRWCATQSSSASRPRMRS